MAGILGLLCGLLPLGLGGCASDGAASRALEQSLAPDPALQASPSPAAQPSPSPSPTVQPSPIASLSQELQPYWQDWRKLDRLQGLQDPNQIVTRRQFARWLVSANNQLFQNRPAWQVRSANVSSQPLFTDVPTTDPDFSTIQGLAEAGILPSRLTGNNSPTFSPDGPLTRETMVLWKVPLDLRRPLPPATVETVQKAWGFLDATKVDAQALRAIAADRENGELSNIRRVFGFTTLLQPKKPITQGEAAAALWYFGPEGQGITAKDLLSNAPSPIAPPASPAVN